MYIRNSSRLQFQEAIPKVAQLLSEKTGIRIRQYGNQAICKYDKKGENVSEIVVPMIPENADNHLFTMVSGFLDHECAHALYTDGTSYRRLTEAGHKVPFDLVNMIEDSRIERIMGKRYPGCKMNLEYVNQNVTDGHIVNMMSMIASSSKISMGAVSAVCLHVCIGKAMGHVCFDTIINYLKYHFSELYQQINQIVKEETENLCALKNTDDTVLEAERIYKRIVNEVMTQPDFDSNGGSDGESKTEKKKVKVTAKVQPNSDQQKNSDDKKGDDGSGVMIDAESEKEEKGEESEKEEKGEDSDSGECKGEESEDASAESESEKTDKNSEGQEEGDSASVDADSDGDNNGENDGDNNEENDGEDHLVDVVLKMNEDEFDRVLKFFNREANVTKIIGDLVSQGGLTPETYMPYMTEFDYYGPAKYTKLDESCLSETLSHIEDMTGQYVGTMAKDVERYVSAKSLAHRIGGTRRGKLCATNLSRLVVGDDRIFSKRVENRTKDVAVELLVDFSGSMGGRKIYLAMLSAFALADTLGLCGIKTQVRGFTTRACSSSKELRKMYDEMSKAFYTDRYQYSRYEALNCPIVKTFEENMRSSAVRRRFASIFYNISGDLRYKIKTTTGQHQNARNIDLDLQNNIDGECVQFVARELMARKEKGKIMIVVSDGYPCANMSDELASQHLKKVVDEIERSEIKIAGIGVMDDAVKRFYKNNATIHNIEDLPKALLEQVRKFI